MSARKKSSPVWQFIRLPFTVIERAYGLPNEYRHEHRWNAYYAIPVLIGFVVTYLLIQLGVKVFPYFHFSIDNYHLHHYTYGIIILLIFGYIGLWTKSLRLKYFCALAHGVGAAFIIDEAILWVTLNPQLPYTNYALAGYVVALLLGIILAPLFLDGRHHR